MSLKRKAAVTALFFISVILLSSIVRRQPVKTEVVQEEPKSLREEVPIAPPCTQFYCGRAIPTPSEPLRLAKLTQAGVEMIIAIEINPDYVGDAIIAGGWESVIDTTFLSFLHEKRKNDPKAPCLFLDAGANFGVHSLYMAKVGCRVVAFEMQPHVSAMFQYSIMLNELDQWIQLVSRPIYDVPMTLYFVPNKGNLGGTQVYENATGAPGEAHMQSVRIDEILMHNERIDLMKIDVEGAEYHVLKSMELFFKADLVGEMIIEMGIKSKDSVKMLYEYGYTARFFESPNVPRSMNEVFQRFETLNGYMDLIFQKQ